MLCGKKISIIFACSVYAKNGWVVIGKNGDIPWRGLVPSDMERFRHLTGKSSVGVGSKTFWSIPEKFRPFDKDLPLEESRQTLILTRKKDLTVDDPRVIVVHSLEEMAQKAKSKILWICGGADLYALALPFTDHIHMTSINKEFFGDTFFPYYDWNEWRKIFSRSFKIGGPTNPYDKVSSIYKILERKK
jgi:dihydrofolate reductase